MAKTRIITIKKQILKKYTAHVHSNTSRPTLKTYKIMMSTSNSQPNLAPKIHMQPKKSCQAIEMLHLTTNTLNKKIIPQIAKKKEKKTHQYVANKNDYITLAQYFPKKKLTTPTLSHQTEKEKVQKTFEHKQPTAHNSETTSHLQRSHKY